MLLRRPKALLALPLLLSLPAALRSSPAPAFDHPLDAPAITPGEDGEYYLTGTDGAPGLPSANHTVDFANNDGIRLWRSRDLKSWELVGHIFDLVPDKADAPLHWWRYRTVDPELPYAPAARGVRAPELHRFKNQWLVVFSLNGNGVGLLRSKSGKPEGPYEPVATGTQGPARGGEFIRPLVSEGGSPSLFADGDTLYLLWGRGLVAPLADDLRNLAAAPRQLRCAPAPGATDTPVTVGARGFQLLKIGARYVLLAEESGVRDGRAVRPVYAAVSDTLFGPYGPRRQVLADAGESFVFAGPGGSWLAAHPKTTGVPDASARPAIDPVNLQALLP